MGGNKSGALSDRQLFDRINYNSKLLEFLTALENAVRANDNLAVQENKAKITQHLKNPKAKELLDLDQNQMAMKLGVYFAQILDEQDAYIQLASILRHVFEMYKEDESRKISDRPERPHSILLFQYYIDAFFRNLIIDALCPRYEWQKNVLGIITGSKLSYYDFVKLDTQVRKAICHEHARQDDNDRSMPKAPLVANHLFDFSGEELERLKKAHAPKNVGAFTMVIAGGNDVNAATYSVSTADDLAPAVVVDTGVKSRAMARISGAAAAFRSAVSRDK